MGALLTTLATIVIYMVFVLSHEYSAVSIPLGGYDSTVKITSTREKAMDMLQDLSSKAQAVSDISSINICFIFVRLIALLSSLSPNLGMVLNSLSHGQATFGWFIFVFVLLFSGFALAGHFQFG